ncbi:LysE family translocator [Gynuella sunshinyii]|uniref:Putative threonine efflux protein n=1 Tax=Gynuella sunshinyii YC6258 TaxID=1445510 RepID=A0A0C5VHG0_9GAMM|nr:LysE family translocator [Gynuella sunshinyii]AJQ93691.1 putative threonine efflux protein [Gynuella sunshinyii YC6258]
MWLAMALFALTMSISPGPVNLISFSIASSHGFKRAFYFVSGATIGFTLLLAVIGLGATQLQSTLPVAIRYMGYAGTAFIIWMGFKVMTADPSLKTDAGHAPNFLHGFLLQWLNPKAWIACISGVSAFNLSSSYGRLVIFVGLYFVICYISMVLWAWAGKQVRALIHDEAMILRVNRIMGGLLILIAAYLAISF